MKQKQIVSTAALLPLLFSSKIGITHGLTNPLKSTTSISHQNLQETQFTPRFARSFGENLVIPFISSTSLAGESSSSDEQQVKKKSEGQSDTPKGFFNALSKFFDSVSDVEEKGRIVIPDESQETAIADKLAEEKAAQKIQEAKLATEKTEAEKVKLSKEIEIATQKKALTKALKTEDKIEKIKKPKSIQSSLNSLPSSKTPAAKATIYAVREIRMAKKKELEEAILEAEKKALEAAEAKVVAVLKAAEEEIVAQEIKIAEKKKAEEETRIAAEKEVIEKAKAAKEALFIAEKKKAEDSMKIKEELPLSPNLNLSLPSEGKTRISIHLDKKPNSSAKGAAQKAAQKQVAKAARYSYSSKWSPSTLMNPFSSSNESRTEQVKSEVPTVEKKMNIEEAAKERSRTRNEARKAATAVLEKSAKERADVKIAARKRAEAAMKKAAEEKMESQKLNRKKEAERRKVDEETRAISLEEEKVKQKKTDDLARVKVSEDTEQSKVTQKKVTVEFEAAQKKVIEKHAEQKKVTEQSIVEQKKVIEKPKAEQKEVTEKVTIPAKKSSLSSSTPKTDASIVAEMKASFEQQHQKAGHPSAKKVQEKTDTSAHTKSVKSTFKLSFTPGHFAELVTDHVSNSDNTVSDETKVRIDKSELVKRAKEVFAAQTKQEMFAKRSTDESIASKSQFTSVPQPISKYDLSSSRTKADKQNVPVSQKKESVEKSAKDKSKAILDARNKFEELSKNFPVKNSSTKSDQKKATKKVTSSSSSSLKHWNPVRVPTSIKPEAAGTHATDQITSGIGNKKTVEKSIFTVEKQSQADAKAQKEKKAEQVKLTEKERNSVQERESFEARIAAEKQAASEKIAIVAALFEKKRKLAHDKSATEAHTAFEKRVAVERADTIAAKEKKFAEEKSKIEAKLMSEKQVAQEKAIILDKKRKESAAKATTEEKLAEKERRETEERAKAAAAEKEIAHEQAAVKAKNEMEAALEKKRILAERKQSTDKIYKSSSSSPGPYFEFLAPSNTSLVKSLASPNKRKGIVVGLSYLDMLKSVDTCLDEKEPIGVEEIATVETIDNKKKLENDITRDSERRARIAKKIKYHEEARILAEQNNKDAIASTSMSSGPYFQFVSSTKKRSKGKSLSSSTEKKYVNGLGLSYLDLLHTESKQYEKMQSLKNTDAYSATIDSRNTIEEAKINSEQTAKIAATMQKYEEKKIATQESWKATAKQSSSSGPYFEFLASSKRDTSTGRKRGRAVGLSYLDMLFDRKNSN